MQSEDFDKKIRDAADNHHPSYNEKAWNKMEKLLDKHLPTEKDDRRRIIFFLLLFLLLGGGTWLFISKPWKTTPVLSNTATETPVNEKQPTTSSPSTTTIQPGQAGTETSGDPTNPSSPGATDNEHTPPHGQLSAAPAQKPARSTTAPGNEESVTTTTTTTRPKPARQKAGDDFGIVTGAPGRRQKTKKQEQPPATTPETVIAEKPVTETPRNTTSEDAAKKQTDLVDPGKENQKDATTLPVSPVSPAVTDKTDKKKDEPVKTETPPMSSVKKKKEKKPTENGLSIFASVGPDLSYVGSRTGKWQPVVGGGLGYTFAKRFTLRAGFYTASKIYSASPEDYKPKTPPPNPQYLKLIDADCKVYEIPVSLAWQFLKSKKGSWFAAAGLSSYIMKKESYDYLYEYPGMSWTYNHSVDNENKHMFSVLSLSGGYSRKLGRIFSVSAEPYFKMPLNGVGFGKVKLNSTGVLVTLSAKLTGN